MAERDIDDDDAYEWRAWVGSRGRGRPLGRARMRTRARSLGRARTRVRDRRWRPPHCPNPACAWHTASDTTGWRCERRGARRTLRRPSSPNQRFRCHDCGRWFCRSAFTLEYWKKIPQLLARIYDHINNGEGLRQAGRNLKLSCTTIQRAQRILASQALLRALGHERRLQGRVSEPLALDGQRNMVHAVDKMAEINTLYGCESGYAFALDVFPIRQGVGQDPRKLARRASSERVWGRPEPRARVRSTARVLARLAPLLAPGVAHEIRTDLEPDYMGPIRALGQRIRLEHVRVSSHARRDHANPLWMANHKHRMQRHSLGNLKRETIAQSKNMPGLQDRLLVQGLWLNVTKGVSERLAHQRGTTPAMLLGLETRPITGQDLAEERLFPVRCGLPAELLPVYQGRVKGWPREKVRVRIPKYAP